MSSTKLGYLLVSSVSLAAALAACSDDEGTGGAASSSTSTTGGVTSSTSGSSVTTGGPLPETFEVTGVVVDQEGSPVEGAIVMQGGSGDSSKLTGPDGSFTITLTQEIPGEPTVVAAKIGYRSAGESFLTLPIPEVTLVLYEVQAPDNSATYTYGHPGVGDVTLDTSTAYCGHCHTTFAAQFQTSAHARSARDVTVQDLYAGVATAVSSAAACADRGGTWRPGTIPGSPGQAAPRCYVGDGALPDLNDCGSAPGLACDDPALPAAQQPTAFGACADCHALGMDGPAGGRDLLDASGYAFEYGNHCDACHHVRDVDLSQPAGAAGRLIVQRPREKIGDPIQGMVRQAMFGPYPDVPNAFMGGSYQPKFSSSEFCAGCHQLDQAALVPGDVLDPVKWPDGLPIHSTYSEWEAGPFNQPATQCQYCHMPEELSLSNPVDLADETNAGITFGFIRPANQIRSHWFRGPLTEIDGMPRLLEGALGLDVVASPVGEDLEVTVSVTNQACGHAIPTGEPLRSLVLVVTAEGCGDAFAASGGQTIEAAGGALAEGTLGQGATLASNTLDWPEGAAVAQVGTVIRFVRPTGTFLDYEGVGIFQGAALSLEDKGLELREPVGEATVEAVNGSLLTLSSVLPAVVGDVVLLGDPVPATLGDGDAARAYAGAAGSTFTKVLADAAGREHVPHHRAVDVRRDNRIPPNVTATTTHTFAIPAGCTEADVRATVLYRPLPLGLSREREWDARDYVAVEAQENVAIP